MYRISDKALRILLVICIVILIASLPFTLNFSSVTAGGNCGDTGYNLSMIRGNLVDFENYQNLPAENGEIRKSSMYIILREGLDNQWSLIYQSDKKLNKERWTSEDLAGFDTIVLVIGYGKNQAYRQGDNGPTTSIFGEALSIQFYDIAEQKIVARDSISNIFPSSTDSTRDIKWNNNEIIEQVYQRIAVNNIPFMTRVLSFSVTILAGILVVVLVIIVLVRKKKTGK